MAEQLDLPLPEPPDYGSPDLWTPTDIFVNLNSRIIRAFKEDHRIDRKSSRIAARSLGDSICMFANRSPEGGIILVGVENDGTITGCKRASTEHVNAIEKAGSVYCPDARGSEIKRLEIANNEGETDYILALRIKFRSDKLVENSRGEAWVREGDSKRRLSDVEKREIRINRGEIEFEREDVGIDYPAAFDVSLIQQFVDSYITRRNLSHSHTREDILEINYLGRKSGGRFVPNVAGAILFAKNPRDVFPGARIRFLKFDGNEEGVGSKFNVVKDQWIDGPLPNLIVETEQLVDSQMRNFTRLRKDGKFHTRPEYPRDAWLEAIVNAVVHRSYNLRNMQVFVKLFDDRFVVESPGGFFPPTTAANIYQSHNPRNPRLMDALFYFDFVKCAHEGTRRMRDMMAEAELPAPEFAQREATVYQVHVTLRNNVALRKVFLDSDAIQFLGEAAFKSLSDSERQIINFIAERGKISVSDANRLLSKDWHSAKAVLEGLSKKNVLERRGKSGGDRDGSKRYYLKRGN